MNLYVLVLKIIFGMNIVNHRWYEIDSGNTLRIIISKRMHDMYMKKSADAMNYQKWIKEMIIMTSLRKRAQ